MIEAEKLFDLFVGLTRAFGILTSIVMIGVGVETIHDGFPLGFFVLIASFVVMLLETRFALMFLIRHNFSSGHCCFRLFDRFGIHDGWKKFVCYCLVGIICFVHPYIVHLAVIAGLMLEVLALLYLVVEIKNRYLKQQSISLADTSRYRRFDTSIEGFEDDVRHSEVQPESGQSALPI